MTEADTTLRYVVLAGNIGRGMAQKILPQLKDPAFTGAFKDKGRFSRSLKDVLVKAILNDRTAVMGATRSDGSLLRGLPLAGDKARKDR